MQQTHLTESRCDELNSELGMQGVLLWVTAILTVAVGRVVGALVGEGSVGRSLALGIGRAKL